MLQIRKQAAVEQREMLFAYENTIRTVHTCAHEHTHTTQVIFYMWICHRHMCCISYNKNIKKIVNCVETSLYIQEQSTGYVLNCNSYIKSLYGSENKS